MSEQVKRHWTVVALPPPGLSQRQWFLSSIVGAIFLVAAIAQLINFQNFSENFGSFGLSHGNYWAAAVIYAELWASAGFFKIRLSRLFRKVSNFLAIAASGFWFLEIIRQFSDNINTHYIVDGQSQSVGTNFFGKYLHQDIGWWAIIEIAVFVFLVLYLLDLFNNRPAARAAAITKVTRRSGKKEARDV